MENKILFIDSVHPLLKEELEKHDYICVPGFSLSKEEVKESIGSYDGVVIRSRITLDKEIIDKAVRLKFIGRMGSGMENIDVEYAENKGIKCLHAPEGNRDAVGEHAVGMLLTLFNNISLADREVREGQWLREKNRGLELSGKTVGIIGYGNMGSAFAQKLKGFNVRILAYDKYKKGFSDNGVTESSLEQIFDETDVLSMHVPLTELTIHMVNDTFINNFKKNIFIINTSRGKVLKTDDLVKNIKTGKVLGACLDVLEYEDSSFEKTELKKSNPTLEYLTKSSKVVLTPHIAGWTHESNEKMAKVLLEKILRLKIG
jgi:D-3-phosphoglycerate dehydrogenase